MFGISGEHLLVLLVILLIFGPRRLPELGNSLGRTMRNFKNALNGKDENGAGPFEQTPSKPEVLTADAAKEKEKAEAGSKSGNPS